MAKSTTEIVQSMLQEGKPLSPLAVAELRKRGEEQALKVNASNIIRKLYAGEKVTKAQMEDARAFFPKQVAQATGRKEATPKDDTTQDDLGCPLDNATHERFAQLVARGTSQSEAYRECYPRSKNWKPSTVWEHASRLSGKVQARVQQLQQAAAKETVLTREAFDRHLMEAFVECREAGDINNMAKLGALILKAKGWEAPNKVEVKDGGIADDYVPRHVREMSTEDLQEMLAQV